METPVLAFNAKLKIIYKNFRFYFILKRIVGLINA